MNIKKVLKEIHYKAGYVIRHELIDGEEYGGPDVVLKSSYNLKGEYIGNQRDAFRLCNKRGIVPEKVSLLHSSCSIGYSSKDGKWYGWSHRAIYGFQIGDVVREGDCAASSGWTDDYLAEHPEENLALPVGFEAKSLEDAKRMAIAFAASVS